MAVVNTGLLLPGLRSEFFNAFNAVAPTYLDLCTRVPSDKDSEKYRWLGASSMVREWIGPRQEVALYPELFEIVNKKWEWTMAVDATELEDAQAPQIAFRTREAAGGGSKMGAHKDKLLAALLVSNASSTVAYDAKGAATPYYFSDSHLCRKTGASMTNLSTSAAATGTQPTTAEMRLAISSAIAVMRVLLDDQGDPIDVGSNGFKIIVPPVYEIVAREALQATIIASTTNVMAGIGDLVVNNYLTGVDRFYLAYVGGSIRPFIFQDRTSTTFTALERDSEIAFENDIFRYGSRARYNIANGEWRFCVEHTFT